MLSSVTGVSSPIMNLDNRPVEKTEVSVARGRIAGTAQIEPSLKIDIDLLIQQCLTQSYQEARPAL
jgi:hypothetical protein